MKGFLLWVMGIVIGGIIVAIIATIISVLMYKCACRIEQKKYKKLVLDKNIPPDDVRTIQEKMSTYLNTEPNPSGKIDAKFIHALELFTIRTLEIKQDEPNIYDLLVRDIFGPYRHNFNI